MHTGGRHIGNPKMQLSQNMLPVATVSLLRFLGSQRAPNCSNSIRPDKHCRLTCELRFSVQQQALKEQLALAHNARIEEKSGEAAARAGNKSVIKLGMNSPRVCLFPALESTN